jgi:hypothetical protein
MSFLDNLENSLKSLERQDERDPTQNMRREEDRARTLAVAPWAEQLKNSSFTKDLFEKAAIAGHKLRTKIYMAWFDTTLRLEAKGRTLELRPTPDGIVSEYETPAGEPVKESVDLEGDPDDLLNHWLGQEN